MKKILIFLSVVVVFGLAINDLIDRLKELDEIAKIQKANCTEKGLIINDYMKKTKK